MLHYLVIFSLTATVFVKGDELDALKQQYVHMILDCADSSPLTTSDIEQLKNKEIPDKESVKCLFACAYKKTGMMSEDGYLSVEGTNKLAQTYFGNDPERLKNAEEFTEACKSVNDESVSDGTKGCDRAALIFKCSVEKGKQFNFI